ncbi:MAG: peptidylprolyl isomerase, partial [Shewanella sp.]
MKAWMIAALLLSCNAYAQDSSAPLQLETSFPQVKLETTMGTIVVELDANKAPITVNNFLTYVTKGHYDNTIFHRVIDGFVVQGGGVTPDFKEKPTLTAIANESGNGLSNQPGTIAMARSMDPHSATSQFFF